MPGSPYVAQAQSLLELSAALTDKQKMIAEYWADGPQHPRVNERGREGETRTLR
jgi:hypothetical protein